MGSGGQLKKDRWAKVKNLEIHKLFIEPKTKAIDRAYYLTFSIASANLLPVYLFNDLDLSKNGEPE